MSAFRLKARLLLWSLFLCVVPLLVLAFLLPDYIGREMVRRAESELRLSADNLAQLMEREFAHKKALVASCAQHSGYREFLVELRKGAPAPGRVEALEANAKAAVNALGDRCRGLVVTDVEGRVVLAIRGGVPHREALGVSLFDRDYFTALRSTLAPVVGDGIRSRMDGTPVMVFAAPILDERGDFLGAVILSHELEAIGSLIASASLGEGSYGFAIDSTGMIVAHPDQERVLRVDFKSVAGAGEISSKMMAGGRGLSHYVSSTGIQKVAAYAPVPGSGWSLAMSMEDRTLFAAGEKARTWILWLAFATAVVVCGATLYLAHSIAAREQTLRELAASEQKFARAFEANPSAMVILRKRDNRVLEVNEAFCELCNVPAAAVEGVRAEEIPFWSGSAARAGLLERLARGDAVHNLPVEMPTASGALRHCMLSLEVVGIGGEDCYLALIQDVTQVRHAEQEQERLHSQLLQAQKVEVLGQLSGGIAHDFNNILTAVQLQLSFMVSVEKLSAESLALAEESMRTIRSGAALTGQLLQFSRRKEISMVETDLRLLLGDLAQMLQRLIGCRHTLEMLFPETPLLASLDTGMMQQVVLNLVVNARDAMPSGGVIRVTAGVFSPKGEGTGRAREIFLSVADTGTGMSPETKARIFEPFFTTKEQGRGTGLGLSTTLRIIRQHQGRLDVDTQLGQGSRFTVYLPALASEGGENHPAPVLFSPPSGVRRRDGMSVLYVEDDAATRGIVVRILEGHGYRVFQAASSDDCLRLWRERAGEFKVLVVDLVLPGLLMGMDLVATLRLERPELPVLITTGYEEQGPRPTARDARLVRLSKPFRSNELLEALDGLVKDEP